MAFDVIMSSSHSTAVSNTHCYVYDPTSHEECDIEDSSRINRQNEAAKVDRMQTSSKSDTQRSSSLLLNERSGHSSNSSRADNRTTSSGSKSDRQQRDTEGRSNSERGGSRSQVSKDRGSKTDNTFGDFIVLSDDSGSSSPKRQSREGQGRSSSSRHTKVKDERSHKIIIKDHRDPTGTISSHYLWTTDRSSSRGHRSRSRSRGHGSQSRHRSRSRSVGKTGRHRSRSVDRRHDHRRRSVSPASHSTKRKRTSETELLKERIEKLKNEIRRTKAEKNDYVRRDDRIRDDRDRYGPGTLPSSPPPAHLSYQPSADRLWQLSDTIRSRDRLGRDGDVLRQQSEDGPRGATADVSREMLRGDRSTGDLRDEMAETAGMLFTCQEPRSR